MKGFMLKIVERIVLMSPFMLPVYFVLHEVNANFGLIDASIWVTLLLRYLLIAGLLLIFSWLVFRKKFQSVIFADLLTGLFLFFGAIHDSFRSHGFLSSHAAMIISMAIFSVFAYFLLRRRQSFAKS